MKKRIVILITLLCQTALLLPLLSTPLAHAESTAPETQEILPETSPVTSEEEEKTVNLTAPASLRAGETVTFTFSCSGTNLRALQGSLTYDTTLLTYVESRVIPSDWKMTFSEEEGTLKYLGLSTENRGLSGEAAVFDVTFQIAETAEEGNGLPFVLSDATVYDGAQELILTGGTFTYAVSRPLSTECTLTALSVSGGNLTPAFSPEITEYSITLPHSALLAEISATACQYGQLKYSNRDLSVGENIITVTVISESGLQQIYTIRVTRLADPNYVPSNDNRILSMELSEGLLFPAFSSEITEYSIYMVEGQNVTLTPSPAEKAVAEALTIEATVANADRTFTIVCNAEDGSARSYTFRVILLDTPEELAKIKAQQEGLANNPLTAILIFVFAAVTVFFLGFVVSHLFHGGKAKKERSPRTDSDRADPPA